MRALCFINIHRHKYRVSMIIKLFRAACGIVFAPIGDRRATRRTRARVRSCAFNLIKYRFVSTWNFVRWCAQSYVQSLPRQNDALFVALSSLRVHLWKRIIIHCAKMHEIHILRFLWKGIPLINSVRWWRSSRRIKKHIPGKQQTTRTEYVNKSR